MRQHFTPVVCLLLHCPSPASGILLLRLCTWCKSLSDLLVLLNLVCVFARNLAGELIGGMVGNLSGIVNLDDDEGGSPSRFPPPFESALSLSEAERGGESQAASDFFQRLDDVRSEGGQENDDEELRKVRRPGRPLPQYQRPCIDASLVFLQSAKSHMRGWPHIPKRNHLTLISRVKYQEGAETFSRNI